MRLIFLLNGVQQASQQVTAERGQRLLDNQEREWRGVPECASLERTTTTLEVYDMDGRILRWEVK